MTSGDTTVGTRATTAGSGRVRVLARLGVAGGLLGAVQAVVLVLWPAQVAPDRFSYPQTPTVAAVTQVTLAVQHVLLLAGLLALIGAARGRLLRAGLWVTTGAIALLAIMELVAIAAVAQPEDSPLAGTIENLYGIPTVAAGIGLVVAGVGVLRGGHLAVPRWLLLVTGLYVFVVLVPALMGPSLAGRIAIGVWMLLFAWLFVQESRGGTARA